MGYLSPPPSPAPVVVYKDVGGLVSDYEAQTERYRRENREVRLHECRSACTLALSLPNVCVYPDAKVKFHQAYNAISKEVDFGVSSRLFASYPAAVQTRLGHLTRDYHVLTGTELIALGMRNCNGDNPVLIARREQKTVPAAAVAAASPVNSNPLGDIAHKVQAAVASALSGAQERPNAPIRVAVADRQRIPDERFSADIEGRFGAITNVARTDPVEPPLPPRRPPSSAFFSLDAEIPIRLQLITGAQPILDGAQFVRTVATK